MLKSKGAPTPPRLLRLFALYENLTNFISPLCSNLKDRQYSDTPISQSNNIVDISGVGLKQFWNLRSHMQDASTLATAHYPETLDRIFVGVLSPVEHGMNANTTSGHRSTFILSDCLGLDQKMVRPYHNLEDLHPQRGENVPHIVDLYRPGEYPEEVRWQFGLGIRHAASTRSRGGAAYRVGFA